MFTIKRIGPNNTAVALIMEFIFVFNNISLAHDSRMAKVISTIKATNNAVYALMT